MTLLSVATNLLGGCWGVFSELWVVAKVFLIVFWVTAGQMSKCS